MVISFSLPLPVSFLCHQPGARVGSCSLSCQGANQGQSSPGSSGCYCTPGSVQPLWGKQKFKTQQNPPTEVSFTHLKCWNESGEFKTMECQNVKMTFGCSPLLPSYRCNHYKKQLKSSSPAAIFGHLKE